MVVRESSFSLFTGSLTLDDLAVQNPNAPDENLLEIPRLTVNAGMIPLLSKRVVFDNVVIANASLHVKREADGTLNVDNAASGWNVDGYLEWAAELAERVDWLGLLHRFPEYLEDVRPLAPQGDPYAPYRGGRAFAAFRPPFSIWRIEIGHVLIALEDNLEPGEGGSLPPITLLEVELSNLAFPAGLRTGPILIRLHGRWGDDPESGFKLSARFDSSGRTYEFSITRLDLPRLARFYATTLPVTIDSGKASVRGRLRQDSETASGGVSFLLEELRLRGDSQRPLFGLPAETSNRIIAGINRYAEDLPIVFGSAIGGPADVAVLEWEAPLLEVAREGLLMAGQREFVSTISGGSKASPSRRAPRRYGPRQRTPRGGSSRTRPEIPFETGLGPPGAGAGAEPTPLDKANTDRPISSPTYWRASSTPSRTPWLETMARRSPNSLPIEKPFEAGRSPGDLASRTVAGTLCLRLCPRPSVGARLSSVLEESVEVRAMLSESKQVGVRSLRGRTE